MDGHYPKEETMFDPKTSLSVTQDGDPLYAKARKDGIETVWESFLASSESPVEVHPGGHRHRPSWVLIREIPHPSDLSSRKLLRIGRQVVRAG